MIIIFKPKFVQLHTNYCGVNAIWLLQNQCNIDLITIKAIFNDFVERI